ncbi:hypothetical protein A9995_06660 [Erythrobacter sp. QSSC1-22B]|uniref:DUF2155 domain-containing protein n=1 Tax=Erythrobacter sp. QSSC1-22B TaxID=1860125 RepID=UPI000805D24E|nr:DUF2155 domain-containing protein [Erythrobacter sp. QSSC1-22B]OBX19436.1 hypothetical protein A9995_06660 [Erythrobacter sp. QSSC1-22B]
MTRLSAFLPVLLGPALLLAACTEEPPEPDPVATTIPEGLRDSAPAQPAVGDEAQIGTPLAERVATIGLLNKRNNLSQELEMAPGESRRVGDVIVRLRACERTAPWELPQEVGAFVQVLTLERGSEGDFRRIFSGWLFKNAPSVNVVEHPIYDVWVKDCTMEFPGEGADGESGEEPEAGA